MQPLRPFHAPLRRLVSRTDVLQRKPFCQEVGGHELASSSDVQDPSTSPATCADCAADAYIRMPVRDGSAEVLCAHCYDERLRAGTMSRESEAPRPAARLSAA